MRFEHLVEINDVSNPRAAIITRAQLWRGLVLRAEQPAAFVPSLSEVTILARSEAHMVRIARYGETTITDEVRFAPLEHVRYEVAAQGDIPRSSLQMTIEEPQPGALFVRFLYEDERGEPKDADARMFDEFRRNAYEQADIDTIGTIRWLVSAGHLGGTRDTRDVS